MQQTIIYYVFLRIDLIILVFTLKIAAGMNEKKAANNGIVTAAVVCYLFFNCFHFILLLFRRDYYVYMYHADKIHQKLKKINEIKCCNGEEI